MMDSRNVKEIPCPQFVQWGFCLDQELCPHLHQAIRPSDSLYQQYTTNLLNQPYFFLPPSPPITTRRVEQDKFANASVQDFKGKLYAICKDQNGCRFLQKKIEEKGENLDLAFQEIYSHFTELMTGKKK
jgi:hypothetical protein